MSGGECEIGLLTDSTAGNYVRIDDMFFTRNSDKNSLVLVDENGSEVTEFENGKTVYAKAHYISQADTDGKVCLYMVEYDENGRLIKVRSSGEAADFITESITLSGNGYVKLFLWDGEIKPVHETVKID